MASPPKKLNLSRDDLPDAPEWFGRVLEGLNPFAAQVVAGLSKGLTVADNFAAELKVVRLVAPAPVWTPVTFSGAWANSGSPNPTCALLMGPSGRVWSKGVATTGTANTTIYTAPDGFRPLERAPMVTVANGAAVIGVMETTGAFVTTAAAAGAVQLDGLSWMATNPAAPLPAAAPWPLSVAHSLPAVAGLQCVRCVCQDGAAAELQGAPSFDWDVGNDGQVLLRNVYGLRAGRSYDVTLLLWAG